MHHHLQQLDEYERWLKSVPIIPVEIASGSEEDEAPKAVRNMGCWFMFLGEIYADRLCKWRSGCASWSAP